ncbi:MAG: hypothetical protein HXX81_08250 [Campylobacterales bacterium]|nr:hypothetical protein [Campylobacterales bacterium]
MIDLLPKNVVDMLAESLNIDDKKSLTNETLQKLATQESIKELKTELSKTNFLLKIFISLFIINLIISNIEFFKSLF